MQSEANFFEYPKEPFKKKDASLSSMILPESKNEDSNVVSEECEKRKTS